MTKHTILVLADPVDPHLAMLESLRPKANFVVGNSMDAFEEAKAKGEIILNWWVPCLYSERFFCNLRTCSGYTHVPQVWRGHSSLNLSIVQ